MKFLPTSLLTCLVLLIACIAWVIGISWFLIELLNLSSTDGWITVGALSILFVAAMLIVRHEELNAIELPDDGDVDYGAADAGSSYGKRQTHAPVLPVDAAPAFRVPTRHY